MDHDALHIKLGSVLNEADDASALYRQVSRLYIYPQYDFYTADHDLAVLILNETVAYSDVIQPACLPEQGETFEAYQQCWITGWGSVGE